MKIALLTDGIYPSLVGGMQKHSYYLAKYLAKAKVYIDLYYFVPKNKEDILEFSEKELKYITPVKLSYPIIPNIPGQYIIQEYLFSKRIYNALKKRKKVDFIYAQGFTSWAFPKKNRIPIGLNLHGFEMFQLSESKIENLKKKLLQTPAKQSFKKADFIFSFGAKFDTLLFNIGIPKEKQKIFFNGIPDLWIQKKINATKKVRKFLFVGRYETRKGLNILNNTLKKLISEDYDFKFIFVGAIPESKQISDSRIKYTGIIYNEKKIKEYYSESDIFVLPSLSEGMPTVILEAMAYGLAIIATNVGAVKQMVDKENGILIPPNNELALYNSIKKIIKTDTEKINTLKKNSLSKVKTKFTWTKIAYEYIDFFNKVINAEIH